MAYRKRSYDGPSAEDKALEKFAELMIEKVKGIQQDWHKPWLTPGVSLWPRNLSGREYCGNNALMLMLLAEKQGYAIPFYGTFNRIVGLNFSTDKDGNKKPLTDANGEKLPTVAVNKGEKSFPVFLTSFTVVHKDTKEKIPFDEYKRLSDDEKKSYNVYPKMNVYNVFNVAAQTNIKEARPELYAKLEQQANIVRPAVVEGERFHLPVIDEMIGKQLWYCTIKLGDGNDAYYSISKDEIVLPKPEYFRDGESFISTMSHECIHSTGAESRLNRLKGGGFGSEDYSAEELKAELGAALVCSRLGITKHIKDDSAAYLKSWLDHMQESPEYLKTILFDVKKATSMMSMRLENIQQQIDDYQAVAGQERMFPDTYDLDDDGNTMEVAHAEKIPFVPAVDDEDVPFKMRR